MTAARSPSAYPTTTEEWIGDPPKTRTRAKTISDSAFFRATSETCAMMTGDVPWDEAMPRHFVALYAILHERVYGVAPGELNSKARLFVAGAAARMLEIEFGGDRAAFASFIRWTWQREEGRERWARDNGRQRGRIGPRLQFSGALLTDYRVEQHRAAR